MIYRSILNVVTPPADPMLIDLAVVKDELGVTVSTTDARLTRWINEATAAIQSCVDRVLRAQTVTETFRGVGNAVYPYQTHGEHFYPRIGGIEVETGCLALRQKPIISIASIVEDSATLDPALDYEIDARNGLVYRLSGSVRIPWSGEIIVVSYTGGYAALTDVPFDLQTAALLMLRYRWSSAGRDPMLRRLNVPGVLEQQFWGGPAGEGGLGIPVDAAVLLMPYKTYHL